MSVGEFYRNILGSKLENGKNLEFRNFVQTLAFTPQNPPQGGLVARSDRQMKSYHFLANLGELGPHLLLVITHYSAVKEHGAVEEHYCPCARPGGG